MENCGDGLQDFLHILPPELQIEISKLSTKNLVEIVLDYGRPAEARFSQDSCRFPDLMVTKEMLLGVMNSVGEFGLDNRAGIERTLHRISCIRNRHGEIVGLTCRVGRALQGTIEMIDDLVRSGKSILFLGRPGTGKTTKLREAARVLADEVGRRVIIVDTSNEIGGDGDVPHPAVGFARRMQVNQPAFQHQVMIEAVENHMPEVIIIDEIGTEAEAAAVRTIAERGVQLIGTAHGQTLDNLMMNPTLSDLIGGIQVVTLSDDEAKKRGTQKSVLERKAPPTFDIIIELIDYDKLAVHSNVLNSVDAMLKGITPRPQIRMRTTTGKLETVQEEYIPSHSLYKSSVPEIISETGSIESEQSHKKEKFFGAEHRHTLSPVKIYPYGIARTRLEKAIREKKAHAYVCNDIQHADAVMIMRSSYQTKPQRLRELNKTVPLAIINSNSYNQIAEGLNKIIRGSGGEQNFEAQAVEEVIKALDQVQKTGKPIDLPIQDARIRKLQHQIIQNEKFVSECIGVEPNRHLRVYPLNHI